MLVRLRDARRLFASVVSSGFQNSSLASVSYFGFGTMDVQNLGVVCQLRVIWLHDVHHSLARYFCWCWLHERTDVRRRAWQYRVAWHSDARLRFNRKFVIASARQASWRSMTRCRLHVLWCKLAWFRLDRCRLGYVLLGYTEIFWVRLY